jgi:hypothetical protein
MIAVPAIVFCDAMGVDCRADTVGQRFRAAGQGKVKHISPDVRPARVKRSDINNLLCQIETGFLTGRQRAVGVSDQP